LPYPGDHNYIPMSIPEGAYDVYMLYESTTALPFQTRLCGASLLVAGLSARERGETRFFLHVAAASKMTAEPALIMRCRA